VFYVLKTYQSRFEQFFENVSDHMVNLVVKFTGTQESAALLFILLPSLYFFFNKFSVTTSEFKNYTLIEKLLFMDQFLILFAFIVLVTSTLFNITRFPLITYAIYLLLFIPLIIIPVILWVINKIEK
jgi:hypothetical protein